MSFIHELDEGWVEQKSIPSKEDRNAFYQSRTWHAIRENARRRDFYKCRICKLAYVVDVHHLTYERWGGGEFPRDVLSLCRVCHGKVHGKIEDPKGRAKEAEAIESAFNEHLSDLDLTCGPCECERCLYFWREHRELNIGAFEV